MPLTPLEQRELDELELKALEAKAAAQPSPVAQVAPPAPVATRPQPSPVAPQPAPSMGQRVNQFLANAMIPGGVPRGDSAKPSMAPIMIMPPSQETVNTFSNLGIRGGMPAAGQAIGAATGVAAPVAVPALGALGGAGGEAIAQFREGVFPKWGAIAAGAATGAIPTAPLAGATIKKVAKEAAIQGGANLGASAMQTAIDDRQMISPREAFLAMGLGGAAPVIGKGVDAGTKVAAKAIERLRNAVPDENILAGITKGYVLTPAAMAAATKNPNVGALNTVMESVGGLAATGSHASLLNQRVTNRLAAEALGLPPNTPLRRSESAMGIVGSAEEVRDRAAAPYRELSTMAERAKADLETLEKKTRLTASNEHELAILTTDPKYVKKHAELALKAGADVNRLKHLRFEARKRFEIAKESGDPNAWDEARDLWRQAEDLDDKIHAAAVAIGKPELADQLARSRKLIAQTHVVEAALDHNGDISAPLIGKMLDKQVPLTDELRIIGKFEQTAGRVMRESQKVASSSSTALRAGASASLGIGGGAMGMSYGGNPYWGLGAAAAGAALPFAAQRAAKDAMFSPWYQRNLLTPNVVHAFSERPDFAAQVAQLSTMAAGRPPPDPRTQPNSLMEFLRKEYPRKPEQAFQQPMPPAPTPFLNRP